MRVGRRASKRLLGLQNHNQNSNKGNPIYHDIQKRGCGSCRDCIANLPHPTFRSRAEHKALEEHLDLLDEQLDHAEAQVALNKR